MQGRGWASEAGAGGMVSERSKASLQPEQAERAGVSSPDISQTFYYDPGKPGRLKAFLCPVTSEGSNPGTPGSPAGPRKGVLIRSPGEPGSRHDVCEMSGLTSSVK